KEERSRLGRPHGQKRETSIAGVCDGALRHTDGSYTCAWEAQPVPTMLAHEQVVETRCNDLARMLAADKPPGTMIQFRFSSGPDPGSAIVKHLVAIDDLSLSHEEAARLHVMNVDFYATLAAAGASRHQALSLWARVPVRQKGDDTNSGLSAFIPDVLDEMGRRGITKLPQTIRKTWAETADDSVVRRLLRDEREAREKAEKVFRLIERECPLPLRRFDHEELWEAVYLGHQQNAQSVPILPYMYGFDVRNYLCWETHGVGRSHGQRAPRSGGCRSCSPPRATDCHSRCAAGTDAESFSQLPSHDHRRIRLPRSAQGDEAAGPAHQTGAALAHPRR